MTNDFILRVLALYQGHIIEVLASEQSFLSELHVHELIVINEIEGKTYIQVYGNSKDKKDNFIEDMAFLANALERNGCDNNQILPFIKEAVSFNYEVFGSLFTSRGTILKEVMAEIETKRNTHMV